MKYVKKLKTKLYFQRGIPTRLRPIARKAAYSRPLGLDAASASEEQILAARIEAQKFYDLYLKTLENTSPDAFVESEIEALAAEVLRKNKATAGQYAPHMLGPKLQESDPVLSQMPFEVNQEVYAAMAVPEHTKLMLKLHEEGNLETTLNESKDGLVHSPKRKLTASEEAVQRAWEAVQKVNSQKPRTIRSLWSAYLKTKAIDPENPANREHKRIVSRFTKFMKFCPDVIINDTTPDLIQQNLDDIVLAEEQRGMKASSIRRNLVEVVAAFGWATRKYRLGWKEIKMPQIDKNPEHFSNPKEVLLAQEQVLLYHAAVEADTPLAAALLLMMHCGAMATEVARLRIDEDLHLDHHLYPYVAMQGGMNRQTKTEARPRFVPIVFGLDLIKRRLPQAIEKLATLVDPSAALNKELQRLVQKKVTGHSLRHTFKMQTANKLMSPEISYAIGGWAGGWINKTANSYGAAGFGENEHLGTLSKELARVFDAVVEADKQRMANESNVLAFTGDKTK